MDDDVCGNFLFFRHSKRKFVDDDVACCGTHREKLVLAYTIIGPNNFQKNNCKVGLVCVWAFGGRLSLPTSWFSKGVGLFWLSFSFFPFSNDPSNKLTVNPFTHSHHYIRSSSSRRKRWLLPHKRLHFLEFGTTTINNQQSIAMMNLDDTGTATKTTRVVRFLLAVCFFFVGLWLAKDSRSALLRGEVIETPKQISFSAAMKVEERTHVYATPPRPQPSGGVPKYLLTKRPAPTPPPKPDPTPQNNNNNNNNNNEPKNEIKNQDEGSDLSFRFCNGLEKVNTPKDYKDGFFLRYRCAGPQYNAFAKQLRSFVEKERINHHPLWGKRGIPANQTFLIIGSSHMQQVAQ